MVFTFLINKNWTQELCFLFFQISYNRKYVWFFLKKTIEPPNPRELGVGEGWELGRGATRDNLTGAAQKGACFTGSMDAGNKQGELTVGF